MIQGRLNSKVSNIMKQKDSLKLIAKGIKPLMSQGGSGYDAHSYGLNRGYESPNSGKQ